MHIRKKIQSFFLLKIGSLFAIGANVTLTLGRGVTLKGRSDNKAPLVSVEKNGTLVMKRCFLKP